MRNDGSFAPDMQGFFLGLVASLYLIEERGIFWAVLERDQA